MNWMMLLQMLKIAKTGYLAPAGDEGGGSNAENGDGDDNEPDDGDDDNDDGDDNDGDDDDGDDNDDDNDGDDDNDDADDGNDDGDDDGDGMGKGAQKRIRQLNERMKAAEGHARELERELEDAKKLSGDDGRALIAAAEATGILPGLMTKDEAKAFKDMADIPGVLESYQDWLDEHERDDELDIGGTTMSYGDVKKRVRKLRAKLDDLKDQYGDRRKELTAKVRSIFETGLAAQKAGWKPGEKKTPAKKKGKKPLDKPTGKSKPTAHSSKKANWGDVDGEKSFIRMIAASNKD